MTRRFLALLIALALISPVFGVWLANLINYHEPLDVAADLINQAANRTILNDTRYQMNWTPFIDYTVPGLPDWAGYIVSAFIGLAIYLVLYMALVGRRGRVKRTS
ncbi:MAG: PDGLE domain-containing protein [Thermoproteus sp.]|jgi:cobalt/nickel transport protein